VNLVIITSVEISTSVSVSLEEESSDDEGGIEK
jgi:hypothetical protein